MTHTPKTARDNKPVTTQSLINRILETPDLVSQIQSMPAHSLLKVINKIGVEDSSELLALATTEQLTRMVDDDLWQQEGPGKAEIFDVGRLSTWLTALEEMGSARAAEKLSEMDEEFLAFAFSHFLNAIDKEALEFLYVRVEGDSWEDDRLEKLLENHNSHEIGGVLVLAKATAPWDSLLNLLIALDQCDTSLCSRLLYRLCIATEEKAEKEGGLFEVLSQDEMLANDAEYSRELRRIQDGFVPAQEALAFMEWVKATPAKSILELKGRRDPVTRAYFREYEGNMLAPTRTTVASPVSPLLQELIEEERVQGKGPLLLEGKGSFLRDHLTSLEGTEEHGRFMMELNFLAQTLILTHPAGPIRQGEAAEKVIRLCEKGIEMAGPRWREMSAVQLFSLGFKG